LFGQLLLALEQVLELQLVEFLELLGKAAAVVHPLAHGLFQGARDVQQGPLTAVADGQIQGPVQMALLTAAGAFAARAGAFDQGAAQERLLGDQLRESGTGVAFWGGALRSRGHDVSSAVLTEYYTLRTSSAATARNECEIASPRANPAKTRTDRQLSMDQLPSCGIADPEPG
jgi:hypothetical protein